MTRVPDIAGKALRDRVGAGHGQGSAADDPLTYRSPIIGQLDNAYNLVIIGSGGAAFGAAIEARRRDARVVMVEGGTVGGTCVNIGCIPSKTLLAGAKAFHTAASHPFAGLPTQTGPVDLAGLVAQKDDLVADMRQHKYSDLAKVYDFEGHCCIWRSLPSTSSTRTPDRPADARD